MVAVETASKFLNGGEKSFALVLQEYCNTMKTGVLYASVKEQSAYLMRFYFSAGEIYHICFGPVEDRELLDILDCYELKSKVFFEGQRAPRINMNPPKTDEIIRHVRIINKTVKVND